MKIRLGARRIFLLLGFLLALDVVIAVGASVFQLDRASDALSEMARALRKGDLSEAETRATTAANASDAAGWFARHPGFALVGWVPGIERDADAVTDLIEVARRGSALAASVVADLQDLGDDELVQLFYENGEIDLAAIEAVEAITERVDETTESSRALLADDDDVTFGVVRRGVERARKRLTAIDEVAERGATLALLLPSFVGRDEPRSYLLAFQSPSEARGGGGLIGVYGLLTATEGRISLSEIGPIEDLGPTVRRAVEPPDIAFGNTYGPLSSLTDWRQANVSPNFPDTSEVLLDLYERVRGVRLDGVVAMDPIALGEMTRGTGPLSGTGWDKEITANSARRLLLFDVYRHFVHQERKQNAYLRGLVDEFWALMESGDVDGATLIEGFLAAARKQHVKIYSADPAEQSLLTDLGLTADPESVDGPLQIAFNNNNSGNKLDFFLRREQDIAIELDADGSATVVTTVEMTNDVPKRGLRAIARAGVTTGLAFGRSRMSMHFLVPHGAERVRYSIDGRRSSHFTGRDSGHKMVWDVIEIGPEDTVSVGLSYEIPDAIAADGTFRFTLWPQTTARPDRFSVVVVAPDNFVLRAPSGAPTTRLGRSGLLKEPVTIATGVIEAQKS